MHSDQIVHGDARVALPRLAATGYAESAKLAYMDPPYNTGRTTLLGYKDRREVSAWEDLVSVVAADCRGLLRPDGSLWLHINDRQAGRTRMLLDEVFGETNYVGTIQWERTRRPAYTSQHLVSTLDPILIYAKDAKRLAPFTSGITEPGKRVPLAHRGNRTQELVFPPGSVRFGVPDGYYKPGDHSTASVTATLIASLVVEGGRNASDFCLRIPSRWSANKVLEMVTEGADFSVPRIPFRPSYASLGGKPKTVSSLWSWQSDPTMPTHEDAFKEQTTGGRVEFSWAKPEGLIRRIIEVATEPGDLVVDGFGGSGTTAVAAVQTGRGFVVVEERAEFIESHIRPRVRAARS